MNRRKILIADDDYDITAAMLSMLQSRGHDVVTAETGEEAVVKFSEFRPDIILLDMMMENFNSGITACKKIRETDKDVKIYLISAVGNETTDLHEALEMGFNGVMSKPVTPKDLLDIIS